PNWSGAALTFLRRPTRQQRRLQPPHHRPGPHHRPTTAHPPAPAASRTARRRRPVARLRLRVHHPRRRRTPCRAGPTVSTLPSCTIALRFPVLTDWVGQL